MFVLRDFASFERELDSLTVPSRDSICLLTHFAVHHPALSDYLFQAVSFRIHTKHDTLTRVSLFLLLDSFFQNAPQTFGSFIQRDAPRLLFACVEKDTPETRELLWEVWKRWYQMKWLHPACMDEMQHILIEKKSQNKSLPLPPISKTVPEHSFLMKGITCKTCGFRLPDTESLSHHMDLHFRIAQRHKLLQKQIPLQRSYYWQANDWKEATEAIFGNSLMRLRSPKPSIAQTELEIFLEKEKKQPDIETIQQDKPDSCCLCGLSFKVRWEDEREGWMLDDSLRYQTLPTLTEEEKILELFLKEQVDKLNHKSCFFGSIQTKFIQQRK